MKTWFISYEYSLVSETIIKSHTFLFGEDAFDALNEFEEKLYQNKKVEEWSLLVHSMTLV